MTLPFCLLGYIFVKMVDSSENKATAVHMETVEKTVSTDLKDANELAQYAAANEHQRSFWQALKAEKKSVFWSVAVSTAM